MIINICSSIIRGRCLHFDWDLLYNIWVAIPPPRSQWIELHRFAQKHGFPCNEKSFNCWGWTDPWCDRKLDITARMGTTSHWIGVSLVFPAFGLFLANYSDRWNRRLDTPNGVFFVRGCPPKNTTKLKFRNYDAQNYCNILKCYPPGN